MPAEITSPCCGERTCQRQQPVRIVFIDDRWWAVTQYAERDGALSDIWQKHELRAEDVARIEGASGGEVQ